MKLNERRDGGILAAEIRDVQRDRSRVRHVGTDQGLFLSLSSACYSDGGPSMVPVSSHHRLTSVVYLLRGEQATSVQDMIPWG